MKNNFWLLCLTIGFSATLSAQKDNITLDLAKETPGSVTISIPPGTYELVIKNKLPDSYYDIKVTIEDEVLEPLSAASIAKSEKSFLLDPCPQIKTLVEEIKALEDETELPSKLAELKPLLEAHSNTSCDSYGAAESLLSRSESRYELKGIQKSQTLTITIKRTNKEGKELEWIRIYKTPSRGKWITSYSFNFITQWGGKEMLFYTKNIGMDSFVITREHNRKWVDFVPGVTFTWLPAYGMKQSWAWGWSGGIGFDLAKPVVYVGGSLIYNQNLSMTFGFAAHQVKQLHGKYNEGDLIRENLSTDQLMIEPYSVKPFISLSLRFDKNPFTIGKPAEGASTE